MRRWYWVFVSAGLILGSSSTSLAVTLIEVARDTVATNPEVLASAANSKARGYDVYAAMGQYLPHVSARAAAGRQRSANPNVKALAKPHLTLNRSEFSLSATQLIVDGWGVGSQVRESVYGSQGAKYELKNVCENVLLEVAESFLNVKRARELVSFANANVKVHEEALRKVSILYRGGAGTRADKALVSSRLARARAQRRIAQGALEMAITRYSTVSGQVPPEDLTMPLQPTRLLPRTLYSAISVGMDTNPAVLSARSVAAAASAHVGVTRSRFFPRIDAELSASANNNVSGLEGSDGDFRGMAVMNYDLIAGGSDLAAFNASKADRLKAIRNAQETQRRVRELIRNAWTDLGVSHDDIEYYTENVESEERVVLDYRKQFELGQRDLFILMDSQGDLYAAQNSLVNARYDNAVAYYRVLASMGILNLASLV